MWGIYGNAGLLQERSDFEKCTFYACVGVFGNPPWGKNVGQLIHWKEYLNKLNRQLIPKCSKEDFSKNIRMPVGDWGKECFHAVLPKKREFAVLLNEFYKKLSRENFDEFEAKWCSLMWDRCPYFCEEVHTIYLKLN